METLDRMTFRVLLFALALVGCSGESAMPRKWQDVRQVVTETCDSLCAWQDRCNGTADDTCPAVCVSMACSRAGNCGAEPVGADDAIDACMTTLAANVTDGGCDLEVGVSQACQDLYLPASH